MGLSVLLGSHSRIDNANSQQNVVAGRFHAVTEEHFFLQLFRLVDTAKLADGLYKLLGLGRRYKLGGVDTLSQQPQIVKFKLAGQ